MNEDAWPPLVLHANDRLVTDQEPDWLLNACVGKQLPESCAGHFYSEGFGLAARTLVEELVKPDRKDLPVDLVVYPIIFLYRHRIELLLKLLIVGSRKLRKEPTSPVVGHNLLKLWGSARPLVESYSSKIDWSQNDHVDRLLNELNALDPNGEAARYSESKKGDKHFAALSRLHVRHFADVAERLCYYLSRISGAIEIEDEQRRDWEADSLYWGE